MRLRWRDHLSPSLYWSHLHLLKTVLRDNAEIFQGYTLEIHHKATSWLSGLKFLLRCWAVFINDGLRLIVSWLFNGCLGTSRPSLYGVPLKLVGFRTTTDERWDTMNGTRLPQRGLFEPFCWSWRRISTSSATLLDRSRLPKSYPAWSFRYRLRRLQCCRPPQIVLVVVDDCRKQS